MSTAPRKSLSDRQKEMLVVMTALAFVEENGLMSDSQLNDAKKSIQSLFIHSSSEETLLRKLLEMVRINHDLRQGFGEIADISSRIGASVELLDRKFEYLKQYLSRITFTPEENEEYIAPLLRYSSRFQKHVHRFRLDMERYLELRETEARRTHEYRIAEEASERLRVRLARSNAGRQLDEHEETLRDEAIGTFNFAETKRRMTDAQKECKAMARQIASLLADLRGMCQMAMNPDMRDQASEDRAEDLDCDDIFRQFTSSTKQYPRLQHLSDLSIDYFRLYQKAFGLLQIDHENFDRAVEAISKSPHEYFDAKNEDEDFRLKTAKLKMYEGLIPFLELAQSLVNDYSTGRFSDWSKSVSELIEDSDEPWSHISSQLLVAKVSAESELTTRLRV